MLCGGPLLYALAVWSLLPGPARGSRLAATRRLLQIVDSQVIRPNPAYLPTIATTIDGSGGQAAALSNPNSAGVFVQGGTVHAAGSLIPGPTARGAAYVPGAGIAGAAGGPAAVQSGTGELPVISAGDMAVSSTYGAGGGAAIAAAAPNAYWVGGGWRATATSDLTGLYGGSRAVGNAWFNGDGAGGHGGRGGGGGGGGWGSGGYGSWRRDTIGGGASAWNTPRDEWGDVSYRRRGSWGGGAASNTYWSGGDGGSTSFAGAQPFAATAYSVGGVGGPVAVAAAGEALAVAQTGRDYSPGWIRGLRRLHRRR